MLYVYDKTMFTMGVEQSRVQQNTSVNALYTFEGRIKLSPTNAAFDGPIHTMLMIDSTLPHSVNLV